MSRNHCSDVRCQTWLTILCCHADRWPSSPLSRSPAPDRRILTSPVPASPTNPMRRLILSPSPLTQSEYTVKIPPVMNKVCKKSGFCSSQQGYKCPYWSGPDLVCFFCILSQHSTRSLKWSWRRDESARIDFFIRGWPTVTAYSILTCPCFVLILCLWLESTKNHHFLELT